MRKYTFVFVESRPQDDPLVYSRETLHLATNQGVTIVVPVYADSYETAKQLAFAKLNELKELKTLRK
jgi:hypothetical protein